MEKSEITKYLEKRVYYNDAPYVLKSVAIKRSHEDPTKLAYVAEIQDAKQPLSTSYVDLFKVKTV